MATLDLSEGRIYQKDIPSFKRETATPFEHDLFPSPKHLEEKYELPNYWNAKKSFSKHAQISFEALGLTKNKEITESICSQLGKLDDEIKALTNNLKNTLDKIDEMENPHNTNT